MAADDPLDNAEADSCALEFLVGMEPLEWRKQFFLILRVEPCAVVPDIIDSLSVTVECSELNASILRLRSELLRVSQEI